MRRFAKLFITGMLALLPLLVTLALVSYVGGLLNAWVGPGSGFGNMLKSAFGEGWLRLLAGYAISLLLVVCIIWIVGYFTNRVVGRRVKEAVEGWVARIPLVSTVYSGVEQVAGLLGKGGHGGAAAALNKVVLFRFANTLVLGLLASGEPIVLDGREYLTVYFPSSPMPATGQNFLVLREDVIETGLSVEEASRFYISLGTLTPELSQPAVR